MFIKSNTSLRVWGLGKFKQLILFSKNRIYFGKSNVWEQKYQNLQRIRWGNSYQFVKDYWDRRINHSEMEILDGLGQFFFPLFLILRSLFHHRFQGQKRIKIQHVATEFWIHISNQDFFPHKQFAPVFLLVIFYVPLVGLKQVMHFIMIPKGLAWFNQDNIV